MEEKCKVLDGRHVQPCFSLKQMVEGTPAGKRKGIYVWLFTDLMTGKPSRTLFGAVSAEHPKGLIFNWCPWCGADLREATKTNQQDNQS